MAASTRATRRSQTLTNSRHTAPSVTTTTRRSLPLHISFQSVSITTLHCTHTLAPSALPFTRVPPSVRGERDTAHSVDHHLAYIAPLSKQPVTCCPEPLCACLQQQPNCEGLARWSGRFETSAIPFVRSSRRCAGFRSEQEQTNRTRQPAYASAALLDERRRRPGARNSPHHTLPHSPFALSVHTVPRPHPAQCMRWLCILVDSSDGCALYACVWRAPSARASVRCWLRARWPRSALCLMLWWAMACMSLDPCRHS